MAISIFLVCMTILFGISAQMLLLDLRVKNLRDVQRTFFIVGNLLVLALNITLVLVLPVDLYMKLYILFVHVPIFFIFWVTAKINPVKIIFALFTAVFMIYPANFMMNVLVQFASWLYPAGFFIGYFAMCALQLLVIDRFFKPSFNYLIKNFSGFSFIKLCLLPLAYYLANYWLGLYNFNYRSMEILSLRLFIFVITLIAYILIMDIAKSAREKEALQGARMALSLLLDSADQQLAALQATQEQTVVYRHDMRHHLALIGKYLVDKEYGKAENYIKLAQADIEDITPNRYCENNTVNLLLSFFAAKARKKGVHFSVEAELPERLSISETELCALLSNSIENAIEAAAQVDEEEFRKVRVNCQTHKGNMLILIENSYTG